MSSGPLRVENLKVVYILTVLQLFRPMALNVPAGSPTAIQYSLSIFILAMFIRA